MGFVMLVKLIRLGVVWFFGYRSFMYMLLCIIVLMSGEKFWLFEMKVRWCMFWWWVCVSMLIVMRMLIFFCCCVFFLWCLVRFWFMCYFGSLCSLLKKVIFVLCLVLKVVLFVFCLLVGR